MMKRSRIGALAMFGVVVLAMVAGAVALIWKGMLLVPPNWARLWALLATAGLPVVAWGGWWFGHTEARGRLAGFDKAVDRIFGGLSKASGLNASHVRSMRAAQAPPAPQVILPDVEIVQRRLPSGGGDVIEL